MSIAEWTYAITTTIAALSAAIVSIINAVRIAKVHKQVTPPSQPKDGRTLGAITEGIAVASEAAALESTRVRQELVARKPAPPLPPPAEL